MVEETQVQDVEEVEEIEQPEPFVYLLIYRGPLENEANKLLTSGSDPSDLRNKALMLAVKKFMAIAKLQEANPNDTVNIDFNPTSDPNSFEVRVFHDVGRYSNEYAEDRKRRGLPQYWRWAVKKQTVYLW